MCIDSITLTYEALPPLQVRFSTKSFGRDAAAVAAKAIGNVAGSLTDADISDIIAGGRHLRPADTPAIPVGEKEACSPCSGISRVAFKGNPLITAALP
jgi:hypothetical protein